MARHRDNEALTRRIPTSYRTPEAAAEVLLRRDPSFGPALHPAAGLPLWQSGPAQSPAGRNGSSWLSPAARGGCGGDDDSSDGGGGGGGPEEAASEGAEAGFLRDRMAYFVMGNLHRLRAELRDRGLLARGTGGHGGSGLHGPPTVTVATAVRALRVAAACPDPAAALAALLADAVDPDGGAHGANAGGGGGGAGGAAFLTAPFSPSTLASPASPFGGSTLGAASTTLGSTILGSPARRVRDGGMWELPVDLGQLEEQLDDLLMRL